MTGTQGIPQGSSSSNVPPGGGLMQSDDPSEVRFSSSRFRAWLNMCSSKKPNPMANANLATTRRCYGMLCAHTSKTATRRTRRRLVGPQPKGSGNTDIFTTRYCVSPQHAHNLFTRPATGLQGYINPDEQRKLKVRRCTQLTGFEPSCRKRTSQNLRCTGTAHGFRPQPSDLET